MISMMKKWMPTLVCGVREALESINRMVHNQFKDPQMGNSSTQAIFLDLMACLWDPSTLLWRFLSIYLQRKHFSFIALTITYLVRLSNSHFYRIEAPISLDTGQNVLHVLNVRFSEQNWSYFHMSEFPPVLPDWVTCKHLRATIRPCFGFFHISAFKFRAKFQVPLHSFVVAVCFYSLCSCPETIQ